VLVPDYPIGGKRMLISDDYYKTLNRPNVELVTTGIDHVEEDGIVLRDGRASPPTRSSWRRASSRRRSWRR
jgi:cation diffusion facilitator CzcD-associated flavoprotein CzcO